MSYLKLFLEIYAVLNIVSIFLLCYKVVFDDVNNRIKNMEFELNVPKIVLHIIVIIISAFFSFVFPIVSLIKFSNNIRG